MPAAGAREAIGPTFSMAAMLRARERTFDAVNRIAAAIRPGMTERQAGEKAQSMLDALPMERIWHKTLVRFGPGTLKTFHQPSDPDRALGEEDIFFVDLGVVWDGHEGDAGDTFVTGSDPEMRACAQAARDLWATVGRALGRPASLRRGALRLRGRAGRDDGMAASTSISAVIASATFRTPSTGPAPWAISPRVRRRACGSWRSRSPIPPGRSAPSSKDLLIDGGFARGPPSFPAA